MNERKYWIVKNTVDTTKYVKNGYAAIGWSNCEFDFNKPEDTLNMVELEYPSLSGQSRGYIKRFLSIKEGDIVIVPCYKGFYMGKATGEYRYLKDWISDDRANAVVVDFEKNGDGEPHVYPREGINTALSTKIGSRHLLLEIYDDYLKLEVESILKQEKNESIENRIRNIENKELDLLRRKIRDALKNYQQLYFASKGKGFEEFISVLFRLEGYETHILSKTVGGSDAADADVIAIRKSTLSPKLHEVLYIQAKHHMGVTGTWGYEQIKSFKSKKQKEADGNEGIIIVYDEQGNPIDIEISQIKYVLISSAEFDSNAYSDTDKDVILIDGEDLSGMIIGHIDELDSSELSKLGLIKKYGHISEYNTIES